MPRIWKLQLKSNAPSRIVTTYEELEREIFYYGVTQSAMCRFLGYNRWNMNTNIRQFPKRKIHRSWSVLLALLSQFPPVWVRNRILGHVDILEDTGNATRQKLFRDGAIEPDKEAGQDGKDA